MALQSVRAVRFWRRNHEGTLRNSHWKHGLGPYGETVGTLRAGFEGDWLVIHQYTERTEKVFHFHVRDIVGKVEMLLHEEV
ncbi:hypothetical protein [Ralstonia phage phiITL-1]|uniref:Uncharacterized protein n=1 Tax=Ralstonia phage phiITL-1 TaxID=1597967 RepID=A0A0U1ZHI9_9CAUD|nr:hypothetical protein HOR02_gp22 [Ralstonia phage phiITL-1]AJT60806.1 hypothetical protein [Ralstonia phage phiITL-1]